MARGFPPLAAGLVLLSWAALVAWEASPYARYMHGGDLASFGPGGAICASVPGGGWALPALLYGSGWLLMSAAMMLPTTAPLVRLFDRMLAGRPDRTLLHALLIAGYLLAWAGFGGAAHASDRLLHAALADWTWLVTHPALPGAAVLALAGAFQFSRLKYHCLDRCRAPLGFVSARWRGLRPRLDAFRLGLGHGIYCVGCCWALMLAAFLIGMGSLGWMLLFGVVMAVEKNHRWGRRLSAPLGAGLLGTAAYLLLFSLG